MRLILTLIFIVALIAGLLYYADQRNQQELGTAPNAAQQRPAREGAAVTRAGKFAETTLNDNPVLGKGVLRGIARDAAGNPVAGAQVICERRTLGSPDPFAPAPGGSRWRSQTALDGSFSFNTLPEGGFAVLVLGERSVGAGAAATGDGIIGEVVVAMYPAGNFAGVVRDEIDRVVSGVGVVALYPEGDPRHAFRYFFERTNSLGEFTFSYLPADNTTLLIQGRNSAAKLLEDVASGSTKYEIKLDAGLRLVGELRERDTDAPVAGAKVIIEDTRLDTGRRTTTTNGNGEYAFPHLYPARYRINLEPGQFVLSGHAPEAHPETQQTLGPLVLHAIRAGTLRGRVMDSTGKKGVANVAVVAENNEVRENATSDASGYYLLKSLPPGDYAVHVAGGEVPEERVRVASGAQASGPALQAPPKAAVRGRVLDELDHPAAIANVFISLDGSDTPHYTTHTDEAGNFEFPAIEQSATIRAWAMLMGKTSIAFGPVRVGSAGIQELNFVLNMTATAAIRGRVQDAGGVGLPGVTVHCLSSDTSLSRPYVATSAADGSFAFSGLRPGGYRLAAGAGDVAGSNSYRADLEDGQQLEGVVLVPQG